MPTPPHILIERHRALAADLRRKLELVEAELRGMELMAEALPAAVGPHVMDGRKRRVRGTGRPGGRQRGALSARWRKVLGVLYSREDWFSVERVVEVVREVEDRAIKPAEVRRLFNGYVERGLVEANDDNQYRVRREAAAQFRIEGEEVVEPSGSNENEPPAEKSAGGSDAGGWGVPAPQPSIGNSNPWPAA